MAIFTWNSTGIPPGKIYFSSILILSFNGSDAPDWINFRQVFMYFQPDQLKAIDKSGHLGIIDNYSLNILEQIETRSETNN